MTAAAARFKMPCVPEDAEEPPLAAVSETVRVPDAAAASLRLLKARQATRVTDLEARVAALERKNTLLTEAVTMLLGMKTAAEHVAITRAEPAVERVDAGVLMLLPPTHVSFAAPLGYGVDLHGKPATSRAEWMSAFEELQANATKTDSLLAALRPGGT
jgi:hypothetical protein